MTGKLTHSDSAGKANMVDVGAKDITRRSATARAVVHLNAETFQLLKENNLVKGDALSVARIAGITAAKKTSELIPLCHQIPLDKVSIKFDLNDERHLVVITGEALCTSRTGVEMEALTACAVAALTLYDMLKSSQKDIRITDILLLEKSGGKSGHFKNPSAPIT